MNTRFILTSLLAVSLAACTNDNEPAAPADGEVAARITASIDKAATRASGTDWQEGDLIGISTLPGTATNYSNIPYKWDGTKFNADGADIYFQSAEVVTFRAYYPYDEAGGTVTAVTDADAQKNRPAIDFLFAEGATADKANPTVSFTGSTNAFRHRMSRITLEFTEGDDMVFTGKLQSYSLNGLALEGSFDTETGEAQATAGETADLTIALENVTSTGGKYTADPVILFPQEVAGGQVALAVTVEGQTYRATLTLPDADGDGEKDTALKPGYNYRFPVRVTKKSLEIGEAEILSWDEVTGEATDAGM